jgi:DNA-binding transcriptional ArsR family regulator
VNEVMDAVRERILQDICHRTADGSFITLGELETWTGKSGSALRPHLEDLKEAGLVVEHPEGFQVSPPGLGFCRSRWG